MYKAAIGVVVGLATVVLGSSTWAKEKEKPKTEAPALEEQAPEQQGPALPTIAGPGTGKLADIATVDIPEGFSFVEKKDMATLNKLTGNLNNPSDIGALLAPEGWLIFFSWDPVGYVKDDDKDDLDADELLDTFKEGQAQANTQRVAQGMEPLHLDGWEKVPYYDPKTNNLTWALKNRVAESVGVNHEVRLLGRHGAIAATWVGKPQDMAAAIPITNKILATFRYNDGERYADYREGDKIAEYGLAGLVLGGGALLALKGGLLAKLGKFIKVIVIGFGALAVGVFKKLKGRAAGH